MGNVLSNFSAMNGHDGFNLVWLLGFRYEVKKLGAPYVDTTSVLGAFAKLRKATPGYVLFFFALPSVCPSAWNNSAPTGWIFREILRLVTFLQPVEKIKFLLKSHQNNRYFACRCLYVCDSTSLSSS